MNVLLLNRDLYLSVGGGQTVYKRLIETNPGITFHYLGVKEPLTTPRPPNAKIVPFKEQYLVGGLSGEFSDLDLPLWAYGNFLEASNIAASVAHLQIDVIDVADYLSYGYFLAPAFQAHGQKYCRVVLALHGNLSETQRVNWSTRVGADVSLDLREQWQYRVADARYGISKDYLDHWQSIAGIPGHYLNPLRFFVPPKPVAWNRREEGVALNFIGRTEGTKGPDLFIELLTWLPTGSYRTARIIGPEFVSEAGVGSEILLKGMLERRSLQVEFLPCMNKAEMTQVYRGRGITVLPSRMDTLNLVALESLFAGCPVAVSKNAGVCRFLRETFPEVPFTTLDLDRLYSNGPALLQLIERYDEQRDRLNDAIERARPLVDGSTLEQIYQRSDSTDLILREHAQRLYQRVYAFHQTRRTPSFQRLTSMSLRVCDALRNHAEQTKATNVEHENDLWWFQRKNAYMPEAYPDDIDRKIEFCGSAIYWSRIDRTRFWSELARLERMRGNDFVATTYDIRVMRAAGFDREGKLPQVMAHLRDGGFPVEAETVFALYGPEELRLERCRALLEGARTRHLTLADRPFELIEDSRPENSKPRISIIVSLYRAANKLETFLSMLSQQAMVANGQAELVLVDSHSPTEELAVFRRVAANRGLKAIFARTAERETIQKAWNRGILLARAPYLTFLGVDEMVRPDCFALLAEELDRDSSLDWVQGNSVLTEVDMAGNPQRDVMLYQRIPYEQDLVYLETAYLSWVGGLYRKNIHDRFGYYDETFGAAGDTEFKNRILPFIKSKTLPLTLGIFLNYPEERTTQSPRAEVEDLRAWYLHRSEAGVEYALSQREPSDALQLLHKAIGYRKSYQNRISSDLDYAHAIAAFASKRLPGVALKQCSAAVADALNAYRALDRLPVVSPRAPVRERVRVERVIIAAAQQIQAALSLKELPVWAIFNDNRYEQHSSLWQGKPLVGKYAGAERYLWCAPLNRSALPGDRVESVSPSVEVERSDWMRLSNDAGLGKETERLVAAIRQKATQCLAQGESELGRDLGVTAQFFHDLSLADKKPSVPEGALAGSLLCRILMEAQPAALFGNPAFFNAKVANLCRVLSELAAPDCPELADTFDGLAQHADGFRAMELAAKLMTYKTPDEAVRKHSAELTIRALETIQKAADAAKLSGNLPYHQRLSGLAEAVRGELISGIKKDVPGNVLQASTA